jgi:hypothetical protein
VLLHSPKTVILIDDPFLGQPPPPPITPTTSGTPKHHSCETNRPYGSAEKVVHASHLFRPENGIGILPERYLEITSRNPDDPGSYNTKVQSKYKHYLNLSR